MQTHHIFIFTHTQGEIADKLVDFGFSEGSSRAHPGQGTVNRKFYFNNFFLEILWVNNEDEIQSALIRETGLTQRSEYRSNGSSPFGLCIVNSDDSDAVFAHRKAYQPVYFPEGMTIDVLPHFENPSLPWTFRLPFKGLPGHEGEPVNHKNGIESLTDAAFEFTGEGNELFLSFFENKSQIRFIPSSRIHLTLTFDEQRQQLVKEFPELMLTLKY
jgi:hypothetical protein